MSAALEGEIRAAGVVCLRESAEHGGTEVLVVHRPRRQDWSLPKGKLERGEHAASAAVRETREETGVDVVLGPPLPTQRYEVAGRPKSVEYWLAHVVGRGTHVPDDEVDEVVWVPLAEAASVLSYAHDVGLVARAAKVPRGTVPFVLLRHGQAEKRVEFARRHGGEPPHDRLRPLTRVGESQAVDLVPMLSAYGVTRVHSSDSVRCLDTVRPYAESVGSEVVLEPALSEHGFSRDPEAAVARLSALLRTPVPLVLCTHRPLLPTLVQRLRVETGIRGLDAGLPPGGCYVLHRRVADGTVELPSVERHAP